MWMGLEKVPVSNLAELEDLYIENLSRRRMKVLLTPHPEPLDGQKRAVFNL